MENKKSELLKIYEYIRFCLLKHQAQYLTKLGTLKDMQHEIFLYVVQKKGITEFNAGARRFIYILAQYHPTYLRNYKYGTSKETVPISRETDDVIFEDILASNNVEGDIAYDIALYAEKKKEKNEIKEWEYGWSNSRPVLVQFTNGDEKIYPSVGRAREALNCGTMAIYRWLKRSERNEPLSSYFNKKSGHIKAVHYMSLNNPFAGSKIPVKRVISETQWDARQDHDDFELEDYNEHYKLWFHKEAQEGLLVRLKQPKEAFYITKLNG